MLYLKLYNFDFDSSRGGSEIEKKTVEEKKPLSFAGNCSTMDG